MDKSVVPSLQKLSKSGVWFFGLNPENTNI